MNPDEIIEKEMRVYSRFQVPESLAESICEPREASLLHTDCEVLPLDVAGWENNIGL